MGGTGIFGQRLGLRLHSLGQDVTVLSHNLIMGDHLQQLGFKKLEGLLLISAHSPNS